MTRVQKTNGGERVGIVHVHTAHSHDGRDAVADLAVWGKSLGLSFIGVTDHAEDFDEEKWLTLVSECAKASDDLIEVIPGLEFRFDGFPGLHLLACGLDRFITPRTPAEFIAQTERHATLTIGAHPVIWRRECPPDVLRSLNAIEIWNGGYNTRYLPDPSAISLVRRLRRDGFSTVATVGPDQHDRRNDKQLRIWMSVHEPDSLAAIREGRFRGEGTSMSISCTDWSVYQRLTLRVGRWLLDTVVSAQEQLHRRRQRRVRTGRA